MEHIRKFNETWFTRGSINSGLLSKVVSILSKRGLKVKKYTGKITNGQEAWLIKGLIVLMDEIKSDLILVTNQNMDDKTNVVIGDDLEAAAEELMSVISSMSS